MGNKTDMTTIKTFRRLTDAAAREFGGVHFMEYKTPDGVASKTYRELKACADALSSFLFEKAAKGCHAAMIGSASFAWAAGFLGIVNCGAVAVPLAPQEQDEMNARLIAHADASVLLFDRAHLSLYKRVKQEVPAVTLFISLDDVSLPGVVPLSSIFGAAPAQLPPEPGKDDLCAIMYTSGTTGFPKGVMLTHENFLSTGTYVHEAYPTQRMMGCLPFHHAFGLTGNITKTMVNGRTLCQNDDLKNLIADFRLYRPHGMLAVPQIVKFLMNAAFRFAEAHPELGEEEAVRQFFGGEFTTISCGSAPLDKDLNDRYNQTGVGVYNGYGMTECAPIVANNVGAYYKSGTVGKPIPCMQVRIVDGEIQLKGPNVTRGYYKDPSATAAAFTPDGWFRSGDLGSLDDEGYLTIRGRLKNLILLDNGENVSAEYLEEKFSFEPLIKECVCYGEGGVVSAEVYLDPAYIDAQRIADPAAAAKEALARVNAALAPYQRITSLTIRDIPFERTASKKIKRGSHAPKEKRERELVPPSSEQEQAVMAAALHTLPGGELSMTDNFFAVGGNSLYAAQLAIALGIEVQTVYAHPVFRDLAAFLTQEAQKTGTPAFDVNAALRLPACAAPEIRTVLLTGASGFLGVHILKELLDAGRTVYALVRDEARFMRHWQYYFPGAALPEDRFFPLCGDVTQRRFGLTDDLYARLLQVVDSVFHIAANVHHAGDYAALAAVNVGGTQNAVDFCLASGAVLQHTSTVSLHGAATVLQSTEHAVFDEQVLDIGQRFRDNVYIRTKYEAETAVLRAREKGLKANIFRIGNLTWRRSDGRFQPNASENGFLHRLRAILKLGVWHENMEKYPMDLTPVDECAAFYAALALNGEAGRVYHMYNPHFLDVRDLFRLLGRPFRVVSTAEAIELTAANIEDPDLSVYMFYMLISGRSEQVEMRCASTCEALAALEKHWSPVDRLYLLPAEAGGVGDILRFSPVTLRGIPAITQKLTPIGELTLSVLKTAQPKAPVLKSGAGALKELPALVCGAGCRKPLLITVPFPLPGVDALKSGFETAIPVFTDIAAEPTVNDTDAALAVCLANGCDAVIGVGGGSVLDVAKITALRAANPDRPVEDLCKLDSVCAPAIPLFLAPSTAGTGSEATLFAVATEPEKNKKRPFTSDRFLPQSVVLDPLLTQSVPPASTAYTGIDALSHAVESSLSRYAPAFPADAAFAPEAVRLIFANIERAVACPGDPEARSGMQQGAYLAGKAFSRIGTGYIHAIAHRFGEFYHVPHGLAIAAAFVPVLRASFTEAAPALAALGVSSGVAAPGETAEETASAFLDQIDRLIAALPVSRSDIPFDPADADAIARKAQEEAKLIGYPHFFTDAALAQLVKEIFAS